jgi:hypothetical protein
MAGRAVVDEYSEIVGENVYLHGKLPKMNIIITLVVTGLCIISIFLVLRNWSDSPRGRSVKRTFDLSVKLVQLYTGTRLGWMHGGELVYSAGPQGEEGCGTRSSRGKGMSGDGTHGPEDGIHELENVHTD